MTVVEPAAGLAPASAGDHKIGVKAFARGPLRPAALASARERISGAAAAHIFQIMDAVVVTVCIVPAEVLHPGGVLKAPFGEVLPLLVGGWIILAFLRATGGYAFGAREGLATHIAKVGGGAAAACALAALVAFLTHAPQGPALGWSALAAAGLASAHGIWWLRVRTWRTTGRMTPNVVVVGATDNARKLIEMALKTREVAVLGVFDDRLSRSPETVSGVPVLGDTAALLAHPILPYVDRIVITVAPWAQTRVRDLIDRLRVLPNAVTLFMDVEGADARSAALSRLADSGLAHISGRQDEERRAFAKRLQDLVIGALLLVVAAPVMALVALAVALDNGGPVFFRQRRYGFNNETITVWKFRSMRTDATDATASRQISKGDERVTRVGKVIRNLSLDELPQLFNVMTGEMSLVGPRPHAIGMKTAGEDSARLVAEYAWRHRMKPGITGWAQINGSIGAVDTPEAVRRRVALDVEYIESQSFWMDLYILAMTVPALIRARNVVR